jgi:hypothetical protein
MSDMDKRDRQALDDHITGHYGEDQLRNEVEDDGTDFEVRAKLYSLVDRILERFKDGDEPVAMVIVSLNDKTSICRSVLHDDVTSFDARMELAALVVGSLVRFDRETSKPFKSR